ncbi:hypothetical protein SDC9_180348 [bioreactor metagenome]|uniref:Uncharacterized protein n=1 Tax=bioreactor metagenome TaxID=1076179 RepID=A0A645H1G9_9ZZZZ
MLDALDCHIGGQHARDREVAGLQDGVGASTQAGGASHLIGVDRIQRDVVVDDLGLHRRRQMVPDLVGLERAVDQQGRAADPLAVLVVDGFARELQHIDAFQDRPVVAADE